MRNRIKKAWWLLFLLLPLIGGCKRDRVEISERYEDGKKKVLCKYSSQGELSERVEYDEAGRVTMVENPAGSTTKMVQWHKNGRKRSEAWYKDGKKQGKWRKWYSGGQIKNETIYAENKLIRETSYKREITAETIYKNGQLFISREYQDGIISIEKTYHGGKLIKAKWFYPDGRISDERGYREGKKHGRWRFWDRNGEMRSEVFYKEGKPVKKNNGMVSGEWWSGE